MIIDNLPNLIGMVGVAITLIWYVLLQLGKCSAEHLSFSIANSIGSICLLFSLFHDWNLPTVVIETVWLAMSIYGIRRYLKKVRNEIFTVDMSPNNSKLDHSK